MIAMVELPENFLTWNYYPRRRTFLRILNGEKVDMNKFFLDSTRHNPALATASLAHDGTLDVNAKIVGAGYVVKERFLNDAVERLSLHIEKGDVEFDKVESKKDKREFFEGYQARGMRVLLKVLYFDPKEARERLDFTKMSTLELAANVPHSSQHTWSNVQSSRRACLVFYRPPNISFELRCEIEIHTDSDYRHLVNRVHDSFHYTPQDQRKGRPAYIFSIEEVYDNSPTPDGFGKRIA
ncbi:MAG: hypothetical protein ACE5IJ_06945 [Thermoplasmata archaeon]